MPHPADDRLSFYLRRRAVLDDPFVELDLGHGALADADLVALQAPLHRALAAMQKLEAGALANADEQRMVGHFWLRAPGLAPTPAIEEQITAALAQVEQFAAAVRDGRTAPPGGRRVSADSVSSSASAVRRRV